MLQLYSTSFGDCHSAVGVQTVIFQSYRGAGEWLFGLEQVEMSQSVLFFFSPLKFSCFS